jgi:membrane-bound inhibitor of C-type lysozyme
MMQAHWKQLLGFALLGSSTLASATDLTLHLKGNEPITRKMVQYQCDSKGTTMGLPAGSFSVEYLNGAGNSLVIVPVNGSSMIFANVMSGSGARYAAGQYIWWDAQGGVNFYSDSLSGKMQSTCHRMNAT